MTNKTLSVIFSIVSFLFEAEKGGIVVGPVSSPGKPILPAPFLLCFSFPLFPFPFGGCGSCCEHLFHVPTQLDNLFHGALNVVQLTECVLCWDLEKFHRVFNSS